MILYGEPVALEIYQTLSKAKASLAVILVGEDPVSLSYVHAKEKKALELGINFKLYCFPNIASERQVIELIEKLNSDSEIDGVIVQLPLPKEFDVNRVLKKISPDKDIDGFFSEKFTPPTVCAILEILNHYQIDLKGKKVVIVGHGRLVGKPLATLLQKKGIEPKICTSDSDIAFETKDADIIISATGVLNLIKPEMVSEKAIIIDAGTAESNGKISGDIDPKVFDKVKSYTPTPGGVGPVTVACLMRNLVEATKKS